MNDILQVNYLWALATSFNREIAPVLLIRHLLCILIEVQMFWGRVNSEDWLYTHKL